MNVLLLEADGIGKGGAAVIRDSRRVRHIRRVLGKGIGDVLRVGVVGGEIGTGTILRLEPDRVELEVTLGEPPPPTLGVDVILALPRPKFVGRILQTIACVGVDRLTLLQTGRVH